MGAYRQYRPSDLFLVRMWAEESDDGTNKVEWHGKVQRVVDGEFHGFSDWQGLVDLLMAMLSPNKGATPGEPVPKQENIPQRRNPS